MTYVVVEGAEAVGKTTQVNALAERLRADNHRVWTTKEPGGPNPLSQAIRQILLNPETQVSPQSSLCLFLADRFQNGLEVQKKLDEGYIVISDRSGLSSFAYYAAAVYEADALKVARQIAPLLDFGQNVQPDICFVCGATPEWSAEQMRARGATDRIEQLGADFHRRVHEFFKPFYINRLQTMIERGPKRVVFCQQAHLASKEAIADEIFQTLNLKPKTNGLKFL